MRLLIFAACLVVGVVSQNYGTYTPEYHLPLTISVCYGPGNCQQESDSVVLDANWRWIHTATSSTGCLVGSGWDPSLCPNPDTCTANCVIEGVSSSDWSTQYGVSTNGNAVTIKFVTVGPYVKNVGSRTYLLDPSGIKYRIFRLLNQEFTFDIDVSKLECGMNGSLYFAEMDEDGGTARFPSNQAGAKYGTGYCDAQCPHWVKWINGKANSLDWQNGGGRYGTCCTELDLWEGNRFSQAITSHPCTVNEQTQCEGTTCGDDSNRYNGVCDKDGCDFASNRLGDHTFFGPGSGYKIDSTKPVTVVTQFITTDGTANGDLKEIRRLYVQNGQVIQNSKANISGVAQYDSLSDEMCAATKSAFGGNNDHAAKGGLRQMGAALKKGVVLVMSLWDDSTTHMLWLDSIFPTNADPSQPGVNRGPCPTDSGDPNVIENQYPDASVTYSNIKVGPIGSTY